MPKITLFFIHSYKIIKKRFHFGVFYDIIYTETEILVSVSENICGTPICIMHSYRMRRAYTVHPAERMVNYENSDFVETGHADR